MVRKEPLRHLKRQELLFAGLVFVHVPAQGLPLFQPSLLLHSNGISKGILAVVLLECANKEE